MLEVQARDEVRQISNRVFSAAGLSSAMRDVSSMQVLKLQPTRLRLLLGLCGSPSFKFEKPATVCALG